ncbi:MAG: formyltransferase [Formivibrio sp.]|nr:formyltransferase [Formivibrio sp.]
MSSAVVFAYHNVGVRCLKVLLAQGVDIKLVVTHEDNPAEQIWFASVRELCREYGIPFITPDDPNVPEVQAQVAALDADFLFSFYYRHMLKGPLLAAAKKGAFNMHGSLLPKYRGRVPVNWAVLHGEHETGATLHVMNLMPDNGALVDQQAVPILPDDTAHDVFAKVTVAAEICLNRVLPALLAGTACFKPQDLSQGAYFGRRSAADGRIDWLQTAQQIHNLVRAVSRPFPGAFADTPHGRLLLWRTRVIDQDRHEGMQGKMHYQQGFHYIYPLGGGCLQVLEAELDGQPLPQSDLFFLENKQ